MSVDNRHWTVRNLYLYLVCIVTLLLAIFAVVEVVKSVTELIYPEPLQPYMAKPIVDAGGVGQANGVGAAEKALQEAYQHDWSIRRSLINLVRNAAMLLVAGPIYLYHWHKIERMSAANSLID